MDTEKTDKENEIVRACIINIPKQRVFAKKSKDLIKSGPIKRSNIGPDKRYTKPSQTSLQKYCPPGAKVLSAKNCKKDEVLFSFRQFVRQQNVITHRTRVGMKFHEAHKFISTDLRNRLHVENPKNDTIAITDTDKDFFNFVNGRPLIQSSSNFKAVLEFFNYRLVKKFETGFRLDKIINIDTNLENEIKKYQLSTNRWNDQLKEFEKFISEDYSKSMACLEKWEVVKNKVQSKNQELESFASQIFSITSRLVALDYKYNVEQKYGRFLYYLSPPSWRAQNREFARSVEIEAKGFDFGGYCEDDTFTILFEKMLKECAGNFVKPALYFSQPSDLREVFAAIRMQQQMLFAHVVHMAPLAKSLKGALTYVKDIIKQETASIVSTIDNYEWLVNFYSERSQQLEEKFYKILYGFFYDNVGDIDVLKFTLHLEFCFEKVFKEKAINIDLAPMAKELEKLYLDLMLQLETMHGEDVKKAIAQEMKDQRIKNKKSKIAARELRLFARLERELLISFAPISKQPVPSFSSICARLRKVQGQKSKNPNKAQNKARKSLTEAELEYLHLFTDWVENEDPGLYLHKN